MSASSTAGFDGDAGIGGSSSMEWPHGDVLTVDEWEDMTAASLVMRMGAVKLV